MKTINVDVSPRSAPVYLFVPGAAVPDGDGGFTQAPVPLSPPMLWVQIAPATAESLESVTADTVASTATHIVTAPYHAGVTTKTWFTFNGRRFNVVGVTNTAERNIEMVLLCKEAVE